MITPHHGSTHQRLHNGVISGVHVGIQGEGTFPLTVVGCVAFGCDDPVLGRENGQASVWAGPETHGHH